MNKSDIEIILNIALFALGFSLSQLINEVGAVKHLKRIADRLDRLRD